MRGSWLDPLRRRKQRLQSLWRRLGGRWVALRALTPLRSGTVRDLPVFCISLCGDTAKRRFMELQVNRLGLRSFKFVDAIDGRGVPSGEFSARGLYDDALTRRYERTPVPAPGIALCLSHFGLWKKIADAGIECALILEDDAVFHADPMDNLDPDSLPSEWEFVSLDAYVLHKPPLGHIGGTIYSMESYHGGTAAYLVSAVGVRKLLKLASVPVCHPIDEYIVWYDHHRGEGREPWNALDLQPLQRCLVYPRPVSNGSLAGYWPSSVGGFLPAY